ncbi:hypothetical protein LPJ64_004174 [Coemansia asiatica]|uniref:Uncharacterized protein n=1 Tax=Coemansia asiatica TaxID=1052880 RepID=A0A9W8CHI8_9FUNG|nr:hypothetical protein LPJ64_004174 [Coemansia asiatica]KAJ2883524.1 hypothetical protein FB639_002156 [Coemansia asiatica]
MQFAKTLALTALAVAVAAQGIDTNPVAIERSTDSSAAGSDATPSSATVTSGSSEETSGAQSAEESAGASDPASAEGSSDAEGSAAGPSSAAGGQIGDSGISITNSDGSVVVSTPVGAVGNGSSKPSSHAASHSGELNSLADEEDAPESGSEDKEGESSGAAKIAMSFAAAAVAVAAYF